MDKKERLLSTAIKLFVKQGFENTPTSQIAKEADVATGTLFYYYATKEELINAAYFHAKIHMSEHMLKNYDPNTSLKEKLSLLWENAIHWAFKNKTESDFIVRFSNSIYVKKLNKEEIDPLFKDLFGSVKKAIKEEGLKKIPHEVFEGLFMSIFHSFLNHFYKEKKIEKKTLKLSFEVFWDAIS